MVKNEVVDWGIEENGMIMKNYVYAMRTKDGINTGTFKSARTGKDLYESARSVLTKGFECVCFLIMATDG